jgi:hypothetical protein
MPARTVRRRPRFDLLGVVQEYLQNRSLRERSLVFENGLKAGLMAILEEAGTEDPESGHRSLQLDEPLEFVTYKSEHPTTKKIIGIQRTKRKGTMSLNEERVLAYLATLPARKRQRLLAECTTTITVINEDALLAANFTGDIPDEAFKALYDESDPTYAFNLLEG